MYFAFTLFNVLTLALVAATIWLAVKRFTVHPDSNWPLAYYGALVAYWRSFAYGLDNYWVLAGLFCGLVLRFEFLGSGIERIVRALEFGVCLYVVGRCVQLILQW